MKGDLIINGKDAYTTWGVSLSQTALTSLMTPPEMKDYIKTTARTEHGSRLINNNPVFNERTITLDMHLIAADEEHFIAQYNAFCRVLAGGYLEISTRWQPDIIYRTFFQSCSQYSQLIDGLAKFTLKIIEPNPNNRAK